MMEYYQVTPIFITESNSRLTQIQRDMRFVIKVTNKSIL